jgi:hypothetical protein
VASSDGSRAAIPALASAAVVPLLVYLRVEPIGADLFAFWNGQRANFDFFTFYKSRALVVLGVAAVAGLALDAARRRHSSPWILPRAAAVCLGSYALLAVGSAWASPFPSVALHGFPDRYEGLFVLLSYVVVCFASFAAFSTARDAVRLVTWLACSAAAIGIVGVLQYADLDPFRTAIGRALVLPAAGSEAAPFLAYAREARVVYATLYHYNYVGSYAALVLPFLVGALASGVVSAGARRLTFGAAALLAFVWLLSGSRGGQVGGVCGLLVLAFLLQSRVRPRWTVLAAGAAAVLVTLAAADMALGGRVRQRVAAWAADVRQIGSGRPAVRPALPLELAGLEGDRVRLRAPGGLLEIRHRDGSVGVFDSAGEALALEEDAAGKGRFRIADQRFDAIQIAIGRIDAKPAVVVGREGYVLNFLLLEDGIRLAMKTGRVVPVGAVESIGFADREAIGSGRGFIWSRSLPLLRRAPIWGFGPDTFAMVFPQHDFAGKFRVYGTTDMLVDKPHSLYLQTALNTGVTSLLALVVLFGWYVATAWRVQRQHDQAASGGLSGLGLACLAGVTGYLAAALFNDSTVCVAPVFWVLLGAGLRTNVRVPSASSGSPRRWAHPTFKER